MKRALGIAAAGLLASAACANIVTLAYTGKIEEPGNPLDGADFAAQFAFDTGLPGIDLGSASWFSEVSGGSFDGTTVPLQSMSVSIGGVTTHPLITEAVLDFYNFGFIDNFGFRVEIDTNVFWSGYKLYLNVYNDTWFGDPVFDQILSTDTSSFLYHVGGQITGASTLHIDISHIDVNVPAAPAPEPSSWAMMLGGFGLVGGAMRRRKTTIAFA